MLGLFCDAVVLLLWGTCTQTVRMGRQRHVAQFKDSKQRVESPRKLLNNESPLYCSVLPSVVIVTQDVA